MICEEILGNLKDTEVNGRNVEYVCMDWENAFNKIHRRTTNKGTEIGIRLDDSVLTRGIHNNDVLYEDDKLIIAAHILPCKMIKIEIEAGHDGAAAKACYEIGNRHAQLFYGDNENTFLTPYNKPMLSMLSRLHGVKTEVITTEPNFEKRISSGLPGHHHH